MSNTVVNTNVLALNSHRSLKGVGGMQAKASARLSSGLKVNSGADDAAGLAISEKMRAQIRGLDMASKNSQDAQSLVQVADGNLAKIDEMLQRARELVVQASNDTNEKTAGTDLEKIAGEVSQLFAEVDAMAGRAEFNKIKLLESGTTLHMQVGANSEQSLEIVIGKISVEELSVDSVVDAITEGGSAASAALADMDAALDVVVKERAKLGAYSNRLEYTIESLDISSENLSSAESRIRDADMAKEMMTISKANVLQQAATSMLSQANQAPQNVLQLLR